MITLANRARLIKSFNFRSVAVRGKDSKKKVNKLVDYRKALPKSSNKSFASNSNKRRLKSKFNGLDQNDPT